MRASVSTARQLIYQDSKLLVPVVCFAELVLTSLWAIWAEQHMPRMPLNFCSETARKEQNVPKQKSLAKVLLSNLHIAHGTYDR